MVSVSHDDLTHWGRGNMADIFKCIFVNENVSIWIQISLKFVPKGPINNIPSLVQIMAWRRPGDKPLSEPMMIILLTHICVTRPQWVNAMWPGDAIGVGQHWLRNALSPHGTKPLPEPILTYRQQDPVTFIWGQFHDKPLSHQSLKLVWKVLL